MSISRTAIACSSHGQPASPASVAHSTSVRAAAGAHHPHQLRGDRRITAHHKHQPHGVCLQVAPPAGITSISGTFLFLRATVGAHHRHQLHRACVEIAMGQHIMSIIRTAFACRSHRQPMAAGITSISGTVLVRRATVGAHHQHQLHRACVEIVVGRHIMSIIRTAFACRSHRQPASPASVAQFSSESNCRRASSVSAAPWLCGDRRRTRHHEHQPHVACLRSLRPFYEHQVHCSSCRTCISCSTVPHTSDVGC